MGSIEPRVTATSRGRVAEAFLEWKEDAEEWCAGRLWIPRALLTAYLAYAGFRHLVDPLYGSFLFGWITVLIHELGHVVFGVLPLPQFFVAAGGTIFQLGAPIASIFIFLRQRDYFGISVALTWLSFSMFSMATYIADARDMALDYVTVGEGEAEHDWDYMLTAFGMLRFDDAIGGLTRVLAIAVLLASLGLAVWLLWRMATTEKKGRSSLAG